MSFELAEGTTLRGGRYRLERPLGRGAHATVWRAEDTRLERPVAVKVLADGLVEDREWLARFRREARVAASLQHPNLVSVYDFDADAERPYLVLAYMQGGSLLDRLDAGGKPDGERLAVDLLSALAHIHEAGIVHRDVKPGNVLLDRDGRACLTDFGVARPQDATAITQPGQSPGTAGYMAPELWGGQNATVRSDLFACGVLLAQCLGDDSRAKLLGLTRRLTAETPELRPDSARAALELLGEGVAPGLAPGEAAALAADEEATPPQGSPAATPDQPQPVEPPRTPASAPPPAPSRSWARWLPVAALGLVALLMGVALAGVLDNDEEPAAPEASAERERGEASGDANGEARREPSPPDGGEQARSDGAGARDRSQPVSVSDGVALNNQGYELIQTGQAEQAVPILERAVATFPEGTTDINYAYALFNLGNAYRLAGRPADAIPILERRLEIPDQTETVRAELQRARREARAG